MNATKINPRCRYRFQWTNDWTRPGVPFWGSGMNRLTPRQIHAELVRVKRISGGCDVAWRVFDADDSPVSNAAICDYWHDCGLVEPR